MSLHDVLPTIWKIREIYYSSRTFNDGCNPRYEVWICPDPMAGRNNRYSVVRVDKKKWRIFVVGREVDLLTARALARRPMNRDGKAITEDEARAGRSRNWKFLTIK